MDWTKLVHPDDVERTNKEVEKQLKGSPVVNFVNRYRCKDGSYKTLEWQATFAREGIVHATARDITERIQIKEAIKDSEEKLKAITVSAKDGLVMADAKGRIAYWNPAAEKIFGYKAEEVEGQDLMTIAFPVQVVNEMRKELESFGKSGIHPLLGKTFENICQRKSGEQFPAELSLSALELKGELHSLAIVRDITGYDPHF